MNRHAQGCNPQTASRGLICATVMQVEDTELWAALRVDGTHLSTAIAQWFFDGVRVQVRPSQ